MNMKLGYDLTIEQQQKLVMTPELIQAIQILQFNTQELDSYVEEQLLVNPVLVMFILIIMSMMPRQNKRMTTNTDMIMQNLHVRKKPKKSRKKMMILTGKNM